MCEPPISLALICVNLMTSIITTLDANHSIYNENQVLKILSATSMGHQDPSNSLNLNSQSSHSKQVVDSLQDQKVFFYTYVDCILPF